MKTNFTKVQGNTIKVFLSLFLTASLMSSCENNNDLESDSRTYETSLKSINTEKNKYQTAILVTDNSGSDVTDQILTLKAGTSTNKDIKVSIDRVGTNDSNSSDLLKLEEGRIKIVNNADQTSSENSEVVRLKFEEGDQTSYLEILVIQGNETESNRSVYQYTDNDDLQTTQNNLRSTSFSRTQTFLGIGYDVINSQYINRDDAKLTRQVLDINKLNLADAILVTAINGGKVNGTASEWNSSSGQSIYTFYTNTNASINTGFKAVIFSGGAKTEFKTTKEGSKTNIYARGIGKHYVKEEFLSNTDPTSLRKYISDDFLSAIQNQTAAYILDNFGSHIIARCYHGGMAQFNYSYTGSTLKTETEVNATINAAFAVFSGSTNYGYTEKINDLQINSYFNGYSKGGNNYSFYNQTSFIAGYKTWVESIALKPDLAGMGNFDQSFIPIWSLVTLINPSKASAIQTEFNNRVEAQKKLLINYNTFITGINAWNSKSTDTPSGYTSLVKDDMYYNRGNVLDANHKAKGDYIRIGYISQEKELNHDAIAEIVVLAGNNAPAPTGWTKVAYDLNKGAKGQYLYLAYRKVNQNDTKAIDFIGSSDTGSPITNILKDSSWSWVNFYNSNEWADINKGCKNSNYIYLTVHKTDFKW